MSYYFYFRCAERDSSFFEYGIHVLLGLVIVVMNLISQQAGQAFNAINPEMAKVSPNIMLHPVP